MKEKSIVSIILPAYNAQDYIDECITSIINQSFINWELIIIDDGSNDSTSAICDNYATQDKRIKAFHNCNRGVGASRNIGIDNAHGIYVIFVDADDVLPKDSIKDRVSCIQNSQMAVMGFKIFDDMGELESMPKCSCKKWNQLEALNNIAVPKNLGYQGYLWNKIYILDIIKNNKIRFDESIAYNEDRLFNIEYLLHCSKIALDDIVVYFYRKNEDSAMGQLDKLSDDKILKVMSEFKAFDCILNDIVHIDNNLYYEVMYSAFFRAKFFLVILNKENTEKLCIAMLEQMKHYGFDLIKSNFTKVPLKRKLKILFYLIVEYTKTYFKL